MNQLKLSMPTVFINDDTNTQIAQVSYVDEGVIAITMKEETYLDEGSIDEFGLLLKEAFKELMR